MEDDLFEIDLYFTTWPSAIINESIDDDLVNSFSININEDIDDDVANNYFSIDINQNIGQQHQHACNTLASVQNSSERLTYEQDASLSKEQCVICLVEFCNGEESNLLVRTQCLHGKLTTSSPFGLIYKLFVTNLY
ncbi:hypothetical protein Lal_00048347 [Lupinus albus]|nr:hypothetical protein Lal_00048347 [Lupinus albus]